MTNLGQLPVEILALIVKQVDELDLYACALINKHFYTTTNPRLWQSVCVDYEDHFSTFVTCMLESPQQDVLGRYIRDIEIGFPMNDGHFLLFMKHMPLVETFAMLDGDAITDKAYQLLPRYCPRLKCIHIEDSRITEQTVFTLAQHYPGLEGLRLVNCPELMAGDGSFTALVASCMSLEELSIDVGVMDDMVMDDVDPKVTEQLVLDLTTLRHLKRLTIQRSPTHFSRHLLATAAAIGGVWPQLTKLSLEGCENINNKYAIDFIKTHPQLKQIALQHSRFTDAVLNAIATHLPHIYEVSMTYNTSMTPRGFRQMIHKCPQLSWMMLEGCGIKAKAFPEVDSDDYLDRKFGDWDDEADQPMHLLFLDRSALDEIRHAPDTGKKRK